MKMINSSIPRKPATYYPLQRAFLYIVFGLMLGLLSCKKDEASSFPPWYPATNENGDSIFGVFENKIPCSDCERTKVALVIYKNEQTGLPTTYILARVYVGKGNDRLTSNGKLTITQGTQLDPSATVYQLDSNAPGEFRSFWKVDENLLFILDENLKPRVGDASYGYVLNRTS